MSEAQKFNKLARLKFYGIIEAATALNEQLNWEAISVELDYPLATLRRWGKDLAKETTTARVLDLLATHPDELDAARQPEVGINPITGAIEVVTEAEVQTAREKATKLASFKDSVAGLQLLNAEVQGAAGSLVGKIADIVDGEQALHPREIASLAGALTSIQAAFFNKPTTNVQVNTFQSNGGTSLLDSLKRNAKP